MAFGIRPFFDGLRRMLSRRLLPTSLGSREIGLRLDSEVKRAAMFSARVEHARVLQRLRDVVGEIVLGVTPEREALREAGEAPVLLSMADAKLKLQQELDAVGYQPAPEDEGTIKDLRTDARLDLMVETNEAVTSPAKYPGQDASTIVDSDPMFVGAAAGDFRLSPGSPAIGAGADLSEFFADDITGSTRVAPWEIGAYEYLGRRATAGTVNVGTLSIAP